MKIMFVGDINLGEYYTGFGHGPQSYALSGGGSVFKRVAQIFDTADLVVGNLEAPITRNNHNPENPECCVLKVDPNCAHQLAYAGIGLVQVANNHIVQHGDIGFRDTLQTLESIGINYVGCNKQEPVVIKFEDRRVAFFSASDVPDNTNKNQEQYQRLDEEFISRVENSVLLYDDVVVMLHWGLESSTIPLPYQRRLAARLKKAGVRAIIGSHPHLFYEIELDSSFVCAYSLGNIVFDLCWDSRLLKSGILEINFSSQPLQCKLWPVILKEYGCLPTPIDTAIDLTTTHVQFDHGSSMRWQHIKKTVNFWANIYKGNTRLKLRFFINKILRVLGLKEKAAL